MNDPQRRRNLSATVLHAVEGHLENSTPTPPATVRKLLTAVREAISVERRGVGVNAVTYGTPEMDGAWNAALDEVDAAIAEALTT